MFLSFSSIFELLKHTQIPGETTSCAYSSWSGLNDIFHFYAQTCIFTKSLFRSESETLVLLTTENSEVSPSHNFS